MHILCIGDSNTWGYNPQNGLRLEKRWTRVLAELMPENEIVEEGLNGRTLLSVDPEIKERCGITGLKMLLMSHKPIDCVVVMLGTNELKKFFPANAEYIAEGVREFIQIILEPTLWERFQIPKVLIVSPVLVREELVKNGDVFGDFDENSVIQSKRMAEAISAVCDEFHVDFMNAADYAKASLVDNIHMDEANHRMLAEAMCEKLREYL